ncbi:hypothetical protein [Rhizobium binae]|uniref:hypothetical protein n=1 Tax=Rhizobium binae TaxID=1138190 RepID=UPI001C82A30C|nr:hypothetical protein [Rhizobium binae]MBX4944617.1 hypothetical protein [Rhizobium binae]MBX4980648.1 hypothetical protein [Rhizobium binae]
MTMEPAVGGAGRALLRRIRLCANRYPVAQERDQSTVHEMGERGYLQKHGEHRALLALTAKGEAFLDRLGRCE